MADGIAMRTITEPMTAGGIAVHLRAEHGFAEREVEAGPGPGAGWFALFSLHRGDHEGRDQDHVHEV